MIVRRTTLVPGGHRLRYPGCGRVEFRRGADQADGSRPTSVFADRGNGWPRGLPVQSAEGAGIKAVSRPSEHYMPEGVEFPKSGRVRDKQVTAIGENRKDGTKD